MVAAAAVLGYWAALELVPVPGFGAGNLDREGNVAAWLDRLVLGPHIWRVGRVYDPEGILSTVPAIATTLLGVLFGRLVRSGLGTADTATGLFVGGAVGIGARPRLGALAADQQGAVDGLVRAVHRGRGLDGPGRWATG